MNLNEYQKFRKLEKSLQKDFSLSTHEIDVLLCLGKSYNVGITKLKSKYISSSLEMLLPTTDNCLERLVEKKIVLKHRPRLQGQPSREYCLSQKGIKIYLNMINNMNSFDSQEN